MKAHCRRERHLVWEAVVSDWEERGRLPAVLRPCRGVTMPLGSWVPGMICRQPCHQHRLMVALYRV